MPSYSSPRSTRASTEAGWFETDLFGGSPRLLVSNLLEKGEITLKDLKALQPVSTSSSGRGGKRHAEAHHPRVILLRDSPSVCLNARGRRLRSDVHSRWQRHHEVLDLGSDLAQFCS